MLSPGKKRQNLASKLLLSTALVVVSLAYGRWQRDTTAPRTGSGPSMPVPPATGLVPARPVTPDIGGATRPRDTVGQTIIATARPETATRTMAASQTHAPAATQSQPDAGSPGRAAAPLSALAELEMYQPPPSQPPLPLVTGTPAPGAVAPIPPGAHLADGNYLSETEQYEWGDLTVRISVRGGRITAVQLVHYPDHRSESLQISQMASPILDSEVIKTQQSKVDIVSSATDTSYVFRDAIANAIKKAIRQ